MTTNITVTVTHPPGDAVADPVADPLICTEPVARARGHAELDANGPNITRVTATGPFTGWQPCGAVVALRNRAGDDRNGVIDSYSLHGQITDGGVTADISMEIECLDGA